VEMLRLKAHLAREAVLASSFRFNEKVVAACRNFL